MQKKTQSIQLDGEMLERLQKVADYENRTRPGKFGCWFGSAWRNLSGVKHLLSGEI